MTQTLPTAALAGNRAEHLAEVLTALYPPPCRISYDDDRPVDGEELLAEYRIVPSLRRPRLLVPSCRRLAAAGLRSAGRRNSRGGRLAVALGAVGLTVPGAADLLLRDVIRVHGPPGADCFGRYAEHALGDRARNLVIHIGGAARANRKPVAALLDRAGHPTSYAKLGVGELSRVLVINERVALGALAGAGLRHTVVPDVVHAGGWRGQEVLVQSALPVHQPPGAGSDAPVLALAMAEVAQSQGGSRGRLAESAYWSGLRVRIAAAADPGPLAHAAESLLRIAGEVPLSYGAWHGDWTPWNCCRVGQRMLVWDWERHAAGAPLGFDALHYRLAARLAGSRRSRGRVEPGRLLHEELLDAPESLAPFGVSAREARVTTALYVVEIAARYLSDGQHNPAAVAVTQHLLPRVARELLAALTRELLPALRTHLLARLSPTSARPETPASAPAPAADGEESR
ncbi:MAG: hypothetical protein GEU94_13395 [Micromonosporaceae bacterium]|nr:hypothetical protein [Micromonosporaceae bacterium]